MQLLIILVVIFIACVIVACSQWLEIVHFKSKLSSEFSYKIEGYLKRELRLSQRLFAVFSLIALAMLVLIILVIK